MDLVVVVVWKKGKKVEFFEFLIMVYMAYSVLGR